MSRFMRQSLPIGKSASASKNIKKHRLRKLPCVRVLQRWMITRQHPAIARHCVLRSMRELQRPTFLYLPCAYQMRDKSIESNLAQTHHHAHPSKQSNLFIEKRRAIHQLFRQRFIARRSASPNTGNQRIAQFHSIVTRSSKRLRSKSSLVQHRIKKVPRAIPGKRSARPVRSMRARRKPQNQHPSFRIAERRYRLAPILPVHISAALFLCNFPAVDAQSRAALALNDPRIQRRQSIASRWLFQRHKPILLSLHASRRMRALCFLDLPTKQTFPISHQA